jgi:hypothetical protein
MNDFCSFNYCKAKKAENEDPAEGPRGVLWGENSFIFDG